MEQQPEALNQQNNNLMAPSVPQPQEKILISKPPLLIKLVCLYFISPTLLLIALIPFNINNPSFWNPAVLPLIPFAIVLQVIIIYAIIKILKFKKIGWIILVVMSIIHIFSIPGIITLLILINYSNLYLKKKNA